MAALRIFAARAAAEIERRDQQRALREQEAAHRTLADEQAALRRVATLVAAEGPEQQLFDSVAGEVGLLFDADVASLVRYDGLHLEIVAGWSRSPASAVPTGIVLDVDHTTATKKALQTGRPARAGDVELADADTAPILRELGIRSAIAAPISVAGRLWGAVTAARTLAEPFAVGAEVRLGGFAELVAQANANAQAREELAASRVRIVEASDAARRRIERNLHDGAQQRLVSLALSLRLAEKQVGDDAAARQLLAEASEEVTLTLNELRELARGIHPAVLTDRGLVPALEGSPVEHRSRSSSPSSRWSGSPSRSRPLRTTWSPRRSRTSRSTRMRPPRRWRWCGRMDGCSSRSATTASAARSSSAVPGCGD